MAIYWTGKPHDTPGLADEKRDYDQIAKSGWMARSAVLASDLSALAEAIHCYHTAQLQEGMRELPAAQGAIARKYCGGGHGGYALYLFSSPQERDQCVANSPDFRSIEPFCRV
jgi:hypothetical protein